MKKRWELSEAPGPGRCWVALSGGLDSTVLLHRLTAQRTPRLHAVHVHHGLQKAADDWVRHCRALCRALDVPLTVKRVRIPPRAPEGPEAVARAARHAALRSVLKAGDVLALAHHRDDQAETVLLRALRGSGVAGLAAMREWAPPLWRPLLNTPRAELRAYAETHGLRWIEDPHNQDPRYARSWLRAQLLPMLRERWPQADEALARLARHAAEAQELLDERAAADLAAVQLAPRQLSASGLRALSPARRHNLLRHWLAGEGEAPDSAWLGRFETELLNAKPDASPRLAHGTGELRRYRDTVYWLPAPLLAPPAELPWASGRSLRLPADCGTLSRKKIGALTVRFGGAAASLKPVGEAHTRTLKYLFQSAGIPPWERGRIPQVWQGEVLLLAGRWASVEAQKMGLRWTPSPLVKQHNGARARA